MNPLDSHVFFGQGWNHDYRVADYGEGVYLYDTEGRRYLDAVGGTHVVSIGHGVAEVAEAMAAQARKVGFVNKTQFTCEAQERLAEAVAKLAPEGMERVTFVTGGSIGNEMALLMAQHYQRERGSPGKCRIIGRWHSYHGRTIAGAAMSGSMAIRRGIAPYDLGFPHIQPPYCLRCPYQKQYPGCGLACAEELARVIEQEGPGTIAAFIAEPIIGGAGSAIVPPPGYYEKIREICDRYQVLFIAEEVITGFGRTGKNFGSDHWRAVPDLIVATKALSSGYAPIGALIVHERVWRAFSEGKSKMVPAFVTYSGHPVSCAAALAVQEYIARHGLVERCARMGAYLKQGLQRLAEREPLIIDVRGEGLMLGVEFGQSRATLQPFPRALGVLEKITRAAFERGLILRGRAGTGFGLDGDHILITPPFVIDEAQCDELLGLLEASLAEARQSLGIAAN
jgi:adenosylmethionine-8-amino-7-oxononanoate aminotransferase